jgi:hypothetical protein
MMATVHVGDCIILTKPDGRCDLFEVDESGERVRVRENLASLHQAWQMAPRGFPPGSQIWIGDDAAPDVLTSY